MSQFAKVLGVVASVLSFFVGAVIYMEDLKSTVSENTIMLQEIQATQLQHFTQRENRFEELEVGQLNLLNTIATSQDDLNFRIGSLAGRLLERDHTCE